MSENSELLVSQRGHEVLAENDPVRFEMSKEVLGASSIIDYDFADDVVTMRFANGTRRYRVLADYGPRLYLERVPVSRDTDKDEAENA